jgi:polyhydroxyalkanoate synthase
MPMPKALPLEMMSAWLAPVRDKLPDDLTIEESAALMQAVMAEALSRLEAFMAGVRAYQEVQAAPVDRRDAQVIWQAGTTRLLDYAPDNKAGKVILVVPSLVNRFAILDIDEAHSFLRFLAAQGFHPLVVDWDAPAQEEKDFALSDYMTQRLVPVLATAKVKAGGKPVHVMGYCMGGVLAMALALMKPDEVKTLTLMATPWDFGVGGVGGVPAAHTPAGRFFLDHALQMQPYLEKAGIVPPSILQMVLTGFQPLQILQKFTRFASLEPQSEKAKRFALTEDWLNDGVPLTVSVARECLQEWYAKNVLASCAWSVAGVRVDPAALTMPCYVLAAKQDKIVPPESALPLAELIKGAALHEPDIGHIGLMVGDKAKTLVWEPYVQWLLRNRTA